MPWPLKSAQRAWAESVYVKGIVPEHVFPQTEEEAQSYGDVVDEERQLAQQRLEAKRLAMVVDTKFRLHRGENVLPSVARHMLKHCRSSFRKGDQAKLEQRSGEPEPPEPPTQVFWTGDRLAGCNPMSNRGTAFAVVTKVRANSMYTITRVPSRRELVESGPHRRYRCVPEGWDIRTGEKNVMSAYGTTDGGAVSWTLFDPEADYTVDVDGLH